MVNDVDWNYVQVCGLYTALLIVDHLYGDQMRENGQAWCLQSFGVSSEYSEYSEYPFNAIASVEFPYHVSTAAA